MERDEMQLHSELLGELDRIDEYPAYCGKYNWLGTEIEVIVSNELSPVSETLERTEEFCRECIIHDSELRKFAADVITEQANELMKSSYTKEELAAGLKIKRLEMSITGFYFVDFLFNGYEIYISGGLNGPEKADIHEYYPEYDD